MKLLTPKPENEVEWAISDASIPFPAAKSWMEARAEDIRRHAAREIIWLLEHPPLYTAGTSAKPTDLLTPDRFPVFDAGRGGQYTYHGPGQRVIYVMLDLRERGRDVRAFINSLENWVKAALAQFNVAAITHPDRVGLWVERPGQGPVQGPVQGSAPAKREDKIAAIGVRLRHWVSFHGISINVDPDLEHFEGIVPCGIRDHGVTSLLDLGQITSMAELDIALRGSFEAQFSPTIRVAPPI